MSTVCNTSHYRVIHPYSSHLLNFRLITAAEGLISMLISAATNSSHPGTAQPLRQTSNFSSYLLSIPLKCSCKLSYLSTLYYPITLSGWLHFLFYTQKNQVYQLRPLMSSAFSFCLKTQLYPCPVFLLSQWKRGPLPIYALDPISNMLIKDLSPSVYPFAFY